MRSPCPSICSACNARPDMRKFPMVLAKMMQCILSLPVLRPACFVRASKVVCACAAFTLGLFCCFAAWAAPPQNFVLKGMAVKAEGNNLCLALSLTVDDEDGLRDLLKDGAVLELKIVAEMQRSRSWWLNADMAKHEYISALRHDPLTREFLVIIPSSGKSPAVLRDKKLARLLQNSWYMLNLPLLPLDALRNREAKAEYTLTVVASLRYTELPPWLEKSPVFWSSSIVPTATYSLEFVQ